MYPMVVGSFGLTVILNDPSDLLVPWSAPGVAFSPGTTRPPSESLGSERRYWFRAVPGSEHARRSPMAYLRCMIPVPWWYWIGSERVTPWSSISTWLPGTILAKNGLAFSTFVSPALMTRPLGCPAPVSTREPPSARYALMLLWASLWF